MVRGDRILAALLPSLSLYSATVHKVGNVLGRKPSASTDLDTSQLAARDPLLNSPSTDTENVGGLVGVKQFKRHFRAADMRLFVMFGNHGARLRAGMFGVKMGLIHFLPLSRES